MKIAANIISRNAPCWCGSGKKYKKCHLLIDQKEVSTSAEKPKPKRKDRSIIIKTEEQIDGIRKSCQMTKDLLDMVEERISLGVTTNELSLIHI